MNRSHRSTLLPTPEVTELAHMPADFFGGGRVLPALVPGCCLDLGLLASFRQLMADCGEPVLVNRMRYDRRYAFERLNQAHCSGHAGLRRLSVILFELYVDPSDGGLC